MSQWSKHKDREHFMLMAVSDEIKLRGKQDPVGLIFVPQNNIFLKIKWLTKWRHQLPPPLII